MDLGAGVVRMAIAAMVVVGLGLLAPAPLCAEEDAVGVVATATKALNAPNWVGQSPKMLDAVVVVDGCQGVLVKAGSTLYRRDCNTGLLNAGGTWPGQVVTLAPNGDIYAVGPGVARSTNGGASFGAISTTGLPATIQFAAIGPNEALYAVSSTAVYRLTKGTSTWVEVLFFGTTIRPGGIGVGPDNRVYLSDYSFRVLMSANLGATWNDTGGPDFQFPSSPTAYGTDAQGAVYVGTYWSGVYKTENGGDTWTEASQGLPPGRGVRAFARAGTKLLALVGDQKSTVAIYSTIDGGATWVEETPLGLSPWTLNEIQGIGGQGDGSIFAATTYRGLLAHPAGTPTWTTTAPSVPHHVNNLSLLLDGTVLAISAGGIGPGASYGIWRRAANQSSWATAEEGLLDPYVTLQDLAADRYGRVFVSTYNDGIYASDDGGLSYFKAALDSGSTPGTVTTTRDGRVIAGLYFQGAFESIDAGATWYSVIEGLPAPVDGPIAGIKSLSGVQDKVYAVVADQRQYFGLYQRPTAASAWSKLNSAPSPLRSVHATFDGRVLVAREPNSASVSANGGSTWQSIAELNGVRVNAFASSADGKTLAAATTNGVYVQESAAGPWQLLGTTGLPSPAVDAIAIGPDGSLYAGTLPGVYVAAAYLQVAPAADIRVNMSASQPAFASAGIGGAGVAATKGIRIEVFNAGPNLVPGLVVSVPASVDVASFDWTCVAPPNACTPASGSTPAISTSINLAVGSTAVIQMTANLQESASYVSLQAAAQVPPSVTALAPASDQGAALELTGPAAIFRDNFED